MYKKYINESEVLRGVATIQLGDWLQGDFWQPRCRAMVDTRFFPSILSATGYSSKCKGRFSFWSYLGGTGNHILGLSELI